MLHFQNLRSAFLMLIVGGYRRNHGWPILELYRQRMGLVPREVSNEEILERCVPSVINEGANLVALGVAQRPSDVDAVYVTGY